MPYANFLAVDAIVATIWLGCNFAIVYIAWKLARLLFPSDRWEQCVLHSSVFSIAIVLLSCKCLGFTGFLSSKAILIFTASLVVLGYLLLRVLSNSIPTKSVSNHSGFIGYAWSLLACLLAGHVLVHGLLAFPTDFDCLAYHLSFIDHWLQSGTVNTQTTYAWSAPANSELLGLWFTGPFSGDFLIGLNNAPVVAVWGFASFELMKRLGLHGVWPHLGTLTILAVHTILHETDDASNDLMVVAFVFAAATYILRLIIAPCLGGRVLCGVCLGVLLGVKYLALGHFVMLYGSLIIAAFLTQGWRFAGHSGWATGALSALFGGGWYLRNFWLTGAPLYPVGASGNDGNLAVYPNLWETSFAGNHDPLLYDLALSAIWKMCGPVHMLALAVLPSAACILAWEAWRFRRVDANTSSCQTALLVWTVGALVLIAVTPFAVEDQPGTLNHLRWAYTPVRYGLPFLSFSVVVLFWILCWLAKRVSKKLKVALLVFIVSLVAWQLWRRVTIPQEFDFVFAGAAGANLFFISCLLIWSWPHLRSFGRRVTCTCVGLALIGSACSLSHNWHAGYAAFYGRYFSLDFLANDRLTDGSHRIAVLDTRGYPFYGSNRQNFVVQPRRFVNKQWLEDYLSDLAVDFVVVRKREVSRERVYFYSGALEAIESDPSHYSLVSEGASLKVFRVNTQKTRPKLEQ